MKIVIDTDKCQGHGRCYSLAPQIFAPDDEGHSRLLVHGELAEELESIARTATLNCPEGALDIVP